MTSPLVSILITSFNRSSFIVAAIDSALNQTYGNIEIIISDNCSTDGTLDLLKRYSHYENVKVFTNDNNIGQFPNRNKAAALATGKYIKYLDSDDLLFPYTVEAMVQAMEAFPEAAIGSTYDINKFDFRPFPFEIKSYFAIRLHFEYGLLFQGPGAMIYRKDIFDEFGGFENIGMISDNLLTLKIASTYSIVALPRDLYWWRRHPEQAFNNMFNDEVDQIRLYRLNERILTSNSCPIEIQLSSYYLLCNKIRLCRFCFVNVIRGRFFIVYKIIRLTPLKIGDFLVSLLPVSWIKPNV